MNNFHKILALVRSRNGLLIIAGILIVLNFGRFATGKYQDYRKGIESKQALLGQYRISTRNIEGLRSRIAQLELQKKKFDGHLFSGNSKEDIASAMQIKLQKILDSSKLNPESLRPITKSGKGDDQQYGEVIIKIRVTGKLDNFIKFLSELYKMKYLFQIENFTLKPYKKVELKIFLELKGFYRLTEDPKKEVGAKEARQKK